MANHVYANNREVACKAGSGKSICAFPDVCFTPPENPATPPGVPIPYPNTGMDSDTTRGSKSVTISRKEIMLKNKSYFKKSMGDEAGCAAKKGVVTSVHRGKVYFIAWSMNVKVEGENVVRNLDMTTHNHASPISNTPPQIFAARLAMANVPGCEGQKAAVETACGENGENFTCPDNQPLKDAKQRRTTAKATFGDGSPEHVAAKAGVDSEIDNLAQEHKADECRKKMRCLLSPYDNDTCCPGQTPHHLVEAGSFHNEGRGGMISKKNVKRVSFVRSAFAETQITTVDTGPGKVPSRPVFGAEGYDQGAAPCVCCEGESQNQGTHKLMHQAQARRSHSATGIANPNPMFQLVTAKGEPAKMQELGDAITSGAESLREVFPESQCDSGCLEAQLNDYHYKQANMNKELPIKAVNEQGKALLAN